jgi:DNA polymerase III delta prime subunit
MTHYFCFCGYKGSGKTTAGHIFTRELNIKHANCKHVNIAGMIKVALFECGYTSHQLNYEKDTIVNGKTVRQTLQDFGEHMRKNDPSIWIRQYVEATKDEEVVVCSDVRTLLEYGYLKQIGKVTLIHIDRDIEKNDPHSTEQGWRDLSLLADYEITNVGDIDSFENDCYALIETIMEK